MSEYIGKYTVQTGSTLHRGDPQPHDPLSHEEPTKLPDDYAGGKSAKNKTGLEKYTVPAAADPGAPKAWR
jgi:hypothetical protein